MKFRYNSIAKNKKYNTRINKLVRLVKLRFFIVFRTILTKNNMNAEANSNLDGSMWVGLNNPTKPKNNTNVITNEPNTFPVVIASCLLFDALYWIAKLGKEVTVVVELRARFDEQANISLATKFYTFTYLYYEYFTM